MSPRHSTQRSGAIFHPTGDPAHSPSSTAPGVPVGTTHSRVYTAPAASRIPGKAFNSGGEAFPVAAALRTARRKTKTRRARGGAARRRPGVRVHLRRLAPGAHK